MFAYSLDNLKHSKAMKAPNKLSKLYLKTANSKLFFVLSFILLSFLILILSLNFASIKKQKNTIIKDINEYSSMVSKEEGTINVLKSNLISLKETKDGNEKILTEKITTNKDKLKYLSKVENRKSKLINKKLQNELSEILTKDDITLIEKWTNKTFMFPCFASAGNLAFSGKLFHTQCDMYPNTVSVIKTKKGSIMGGFTTQTWEGENAKYDDKAFIFNLNDKIKFNIRKGKPAIEPSFVNLPVFGKDLALTKDIYYSSFPSSYSNEDEYGNTHDLYIEKKTMIEPIAIEVFVLN